MCACGGPPELTPHAADKLLEETLSADGQYVYSVADELGLPPDLTLRTFPADSPVGRLIAARLITRAENPDEIYSVAGNFLGGLGPCFRVSVRVTTADPAGITGTYLAERRTTCPEDAGPLRQTGEVEGSYDPSALSWRLRFSPALHGAAPDAVLRVGLDRDRRLHWDGQAGEGATATFSLVGEKPARSIPVVKYRYNVSKKLAAARQPGGTIAAGRYVVDMVDQVTPAGDGATARASFAWHVVATDVGEIITPRLSVKGKGQAEFERRGSAWSLKTVTLGR